MPDPSDDTTPITPPRDPANDTTLMSAKGTRPQHAVSSDTPGIGRGGWWAITIAAAAWLIIGFLLAFGPARYWTPVPAVFLGYFLVSGVIGLVFWKGVRELQNSDPNLRTDDPAPTGQRVAAAIGAVGIAAAVILLPAGLSSAPANALPCPDGSNTCGPTAPTQDQPTQGNGGNTTAPQAPQTTIPPNVDTGLPQAPTQGNGNGFQGTVQQMPTPDNVDPNSCIVGCPTQAQQAPQTGQATPPQTGQPQTGQNPVTTAPNTVATTPQAPTSTPKLRTPTPETTTSSKQRDNDDDQQRSSDEDRDKNSGIPYQAAELSALAGTYRRRKTTEAGKAVFDDTATYLRGDDAVVGESSTVLPGQAAPTEVSVTGPGGPTTTTRMFQTIAVPPGTRESGVNSVLYPNIPASWTIDPDKTPGAVGNWSQNVIVGSGSGRPGTVGVPLSPEQGTGKGRSIDLNVSRQYQLRVVGLEAVATRAIDYNGKSVLGVVYQNIYQVQSTTSGGVNGTQIVTTPQWAPASPELVAQLAAKGVPVPHV